MLGSAIDLLVAVLLVVTICYCALLNRRLGRLRADEAALKAMVIELVNASEAAEHSVAEYRRVSTACDGLLAERLDDAKRFGGFITREIDRGEKVLERLAQLSEFARANRLAPRGGAQDEGLGKVA